MRFCVPCENEWAFDDDVCIGCGQPGERGVHDWGITVKLTAAENRALARVAEATGGKP